MTKFGQKFYSKIQERQKTKIVERRRRQPTKTPSFSFFFRLFLFYILKNLQKIHKCQRFGVHPTPLLRRLILKQKLNIIK